MSIRRIPAYTVIYSPVSKHGNHFKHLYHIQFLCREKPYVPREPQRDPSNRRLNEHGIYIRHCQESNSQPVLSQAGADTTRPQFVDTVSVLHPTKCNTNSKVFYLITRKLKNTYNFFFQGIFSYALHSL